MYVNIPILNFKYLKQKGGPSERCILDLFSVASGTFRMSRVETRKIVEDDGGQTTGGRPVRRLQRGGGTEGSQEPFRTSQGVRRKGTNFHPLTVLAHANLLVKS